MVCRASEVRLLDADKTQIGIISLKEAIKMATDQVIADVPTHRCAQHVLDILLQNAEEHREHHFNLIPEDKVLLRFSGRQSDGCRQCMDLLDQPEFISRRFAEPCPCFDGLLTLM